ncbi:MAG: hypothetical protein ONB16_09990 [candidate division KSB1 bacterium]|nr:hypothetical protein [candidate division KSB1 bacterium]MDZ7318502.1 hypothetical protein [candidate division KSB1 bacterium]MDZ7340013.1 hypothetical protein [candidate division KSB1 bacterium]
MDKRLVSIAMTMAAVIILTTGNVFGQHRPRLWRQQPRTMAPASAIGVRVGNDFKQDQYFVGAHFWLPVGHFWRFVPSAEYYFNDAEFRRWQFNGDFLFKPRPIGWLHFGGGVAVQYLTLAKQTDVGGNVIVGLDFHRPRMGGITPYFQARWTMLNPHDRFFSLVGGINLILR